MGYLREAARFAARNRDALAAIVVVLAALLACGGGDESCSVKLTYKGKTVPGAGKTLKDAKRGGCWKYCIDHDKSVDKAWRSWKKNNSPKSNAKTSDLEDDPGLKKLLRGCEDACLTDVEKGKGEIGSKSNCD